MQSDALLDCAGRRRSPATLSTFHQGRAPRTKGLRYPPDPPTVEEIIAVMHPAGENPDGLRLRGIIVVLWRAGLRISEALALSETDLDPDRGALLIRHGKGGKRREVASEPLTKCQVDAAQVRGDRSKERHELVQAALRRLDDGRPVSDRHAARDEFGPSPPAPPSNAGPG